MSKSLDLDIVIYKKALAFLCRREHSTHELRQKLQARFPSANVSINQVLTELQTQNYLRDQAFAEMLLRHRAQQAYGPHYVQQELGRHHLSLSSELLSAQDAQEAFFQGFLAKFKRRYQSMPKPMLARAEVLDYFTKRGYPRALLHSYFERLEESPEPN